MYNYEFSCSNPEGLDYSIKFSHENKFTQQEFSKICEDILIEYLKEAIKVNKNDNKEMKDYWSLQPDSELIIKKLEEKGFKIVKRNYQGYYDFEPWLGHFSEELQTLIDEHVHI